MLHLIATTMLFFGYKDNIIATYPDLLSQTDSRYIGGKTSFLAANILIIIGLGVEIIILFIGVNMFKERLSVLVSTLHLFGAILTVTYGFAPWQFDTIWSLWAVFSLFPVTIEILSACYQPSK
jgi:hypothetical protein